MPPRRLDPRAIDDLSDVVEERILEKIRVEFRSEIALMKGDMIVEIVSALGGVPRHVGIEDGYEEATEDFEFFESNGEARTDRIDRPMGNRVGQFSRLGS